MVRASPARTKHRVSLVMCCVVVEWQVFAALREPGSVSERLPRVQHTLQGDRQPVIGQSGGVGQHLSDALLLHAALRTHRTS